MSEKIIRVPKGWTIKYNTPDGQEREATLTTNKEYRITLTNSAEAFPIITVKKVQKTPGGDEEIIPKLQLDLGFMDPIHQATCGNIPVSQISNVEEVTTGYVSDRRSRKTMDALKKKPYTFAFDKKDGGEYRMSVYPGEMVSLSVKDTRPNAKGKSRSIYGAFKDFDEKTNELIITRYLAVSNVRQIAEDYRVQLDSLFAIFRYALAIKEETPAPAEDKETAPAAETATTPAEDTPEEPTAE